ncbi:hypothetical protein HOY80DRAFT_1035567 [Tuber brumale]|nr:hypothetical protein HOY80DRAFT_1035567 [Tuber brumale]
MGSSTTSWTWNSGFKIACSGDTRPTKGFVEIGGNSTVLLHEATFDDELLPEAITKKHPTTINDIRVANFKCCGGERARGIIPVAFDLCRVRLGDVKRFGTFIPALRTLYGEVDEEGEEIDEEEPVAKEKKKGKVGKIGA